MHLSDVPELVPAVVSFENKNSPLSVPFKISEISEKCKNRALRTAVRMSNRNETATASVTATSNRNLQPQRITASLIVKI